MTDYLDYEDDAAEVAPPAKWWTGSHVAIIAADLAVTEVVAALPGFHNGQEAPNNTARWAVPHETATPGLWTIPAYPGMSAPDGCEESERIEFPTEESKP